MYDEELILTQLEDLKSKYIRINQIHGERINEETIKIAIVEDFFTIIGYDKEYFYYEDVIDNRDRVDICIKDIKTKEPIVYVEIKNPNIKLTKKEFIQLANYVHTSNIKWGILTNGKNYILFHTEVTGKAEEKYVFTFNLFDNEEKNSYFSKLRNINNLKLLSYDYLVQDKSRYLIYLANFRNTFENKQSFRQYESTLNPYLNFLADNYNYDLSYITPDTFKAFLIKYLKLSSVNNKKTNHKATIRNKISHVNSFYTAVIERDQKRNPFKRYTQTEFLDYILGENDLKDKDTIHAPLVTIEELNMLLTCIKENRHSLRNKVILLLFIYAGLDQKELSNLKLDNINNKATKLNVGKRELPLPLNLGIILREYISERNSIKTKCDYLFCGGKYNGKYSKLLDSNINLIINEQFNLLNIPNERKKLLNTSFIKRSLIKNMFIKGISLQEIAKFTGLTLPSLAKYITKEDIEDVSLINVLKNHPYNEIFKNLR